MKQKKDLGIWISPDMKCSDHCLYAFNKASKVMIKRSVKYKEARIMVSLYKTLVRPHVEYCVNTWSPYYRKDKELLEKVQCRFTKMIINVEGLSYDERLRHLNLCTLEERKNRQDLIEVFKMSQGKSVIGLQDLFIIGKEQQGNKRSFMKVRPN